MARFYAEMQGNCSCEPATCEGTKESGMRLLIKGMNIGIYVRCYVDREGKDVIQIYDSGPNADAADSYLVHTLRE